MTERIAGAIVNAVVASLGGLLVAVADGPTWAALGMGFLLFAVATATDDVIREVKKARR